MRSFHSSVKNSANGGQDLRRCQHRRVYLNVVAIPRVVLASENFLPGGRDEARDIGVSGFNAAAMLRLIRASDFDLLNSDSHSFRDFAPGIPRNRNRIDTVCHDCSSEPEIVFRKGIRNAIASIVHRLTDGSGIAQGLLDGVDSKIYRVDFTSEFTSNARFTDAGKSTEDDQSRQPAASRILTFHDD